MPLGAARRSAGEAFRHRIVRPEIPDGAVAVADGVAIDAAMRAGIVGADVARQGAAATRPIAAFAGRHGALADIGQAVGVNAAGFAEARDQQVGLAA